MCKLKWYSSIRLILLRTRIDRIYSSSFMLGSYMNCEEVESGTRTACFLTRTVSLSVSSPCEKFCFTGFYQRQSRAFLFSTVQCDLPTQLQIFCDHDVSSLDLFAIGSLSRSQLQADSDANEYKACEDHNPPQRCAWRPRQGRLGKTIVCEMEILGDRRL